MSHPVELCQRQSKSKRRVTWVGVHWHPKPSESEFHGQCVWTLLWTRAFSECHGRQTSSTDLCLVVSDLCRCCYLSVCTVAHSRNGCPTKPVDRFYRYHRHPRSRSHQWDVVCQHSYRVESCRRNSRSSRGAIAQCVVSACCVGLRLFSIETMKQFMLSIGLWKRRDCPLHFALGEEWATWLSLWKATQSPIFRWVI